MAWRLSFFCFVPLALRGALVHLTKLQAFTHRSCVNKLQKHYSLTPLVCCSFFYTEFYNMRQTFMMSDMHQLKWRLLFTKSSGVKLLSTFTFCDGCNFQSSFFFDVLFQIQISRSLCICLLVCRSAVFFFAEPCACTVWRIGINLDICFLRSNLIFLIWYLF